MGRRAPNPPIRRSDASIRCVMLRTGTGCYSGVLDHRGIRAATTCRLAATVAPGMASAMFYEISCGTDTAAESDGLRGAEMRDQAKHKMVGRAIFDVPRPRHALRMAAITSADSKQTCKSGHRVKRRLSRSYPGQMERCLPPRWDGYPTATPGFRSKHWSGSDKDRRDRQ